MVNTTIAGHVRYQSQDHGGVVILDTAEGEWLALNAAAGDFWRVWGAGASFEEGLRLVAAQYPHVPAEALRADAVRLMSEFRERGLLTDGTAPGSTAPGSTAPTEAVPMTVGGEAVMAEAAVRAGAARPGWVRGVLALCVLAAACLIVRCCSFRAQLALVRAARRLHRKDAASGEAAVVVAAVDWAARRYPGRAAGIVSRVPDQGWFPHRGRRRGGRRSGGRTIRAAAGGRTRPIVSPARNPWSHRQGRHGGGL
jgi:hypothetical protein